MFKKTALFIILVSSLSVSACCQPKPTPVVTPTIRLRTPPAEKAFPSNPEKVAVGKVIVLREKVVKKEGQPDEKIVEQVTLDAKDMIIIEEKTFLIYAQELLQRRAWDKYAFTAVNKVNNIGKTNEAQTDSQVAPKNGN